MFNFRFDIPDETTYELIAVSVDGSASVSITDQRVLGAIKNGYLSRYCRAKIKANNESCLTSSLQYWVKRYQTFEPQLPPSLRGFGSMKLVETISKTEIATEKIR